MSGRVADESTPAWGAARPRLSARAVLAGWLLATAGLLAAAVLLPGLRVDGILGAFGVAAVVGILNALIVPAIARIRLPLTIVSGFLVVLVLDAAVLWFAADTIEGSIAVDNFGWAVAGALVAAAATLVFQIALGVNNDDTYSLRVIERMARRSGKQVRTDRPGIVFVEIDGLAFPVLQRALRDGHAPEMARWLAAGTHRLVEWETDLSSQTGASQAGILLGSNDDIPAFRWVEKDTGTLMTCSAPRDCAEIERRHTNGAGLLVDGGTSRGNLLSGGADEVILTVSRIKAERKANPGYRAFFANGHNVTRALALFVGEVVIELWAAARQRRRGVLPRGHRGGTYPFLRAAMCVVIRDLIVFSVISDVLRGRPAVYATLSSYDEVAHHSGLERHDTLEALRKLDKQVGRIARASRYAPRPYEIVVLSDHGQTQGATFKQRNGFGLDDLVRRSIEERPVQTLLGGDENETAVGLAFEEAPGRRGRARGERKEEARGRACRRRPRVGQPRTHLPDGGSSPAHARGDRGPASAPRGRSSRASPRRLRRRPLVGARACGPRSPRRPLPRRGSRSGRGSSRRVPCQRRSPSRALERLRACAGHLREQLLRPADRRGLRLRGADLVPRRHGGLADASVHPRARDAAAARGADRRGGGGTHGLERLESAAEPRVGGSPTSTLPAHSGRVNLPCPSLRRADLFRLRHLAGVARGRRGRAETQASGVAYDLFAEPLARLENGAVMTDVTPPGNAKPPIHVSGVPLDSRAGRRLKAGEGGYADHLAHRLHLLPSLFVSWLVANAGVVVLAAIMVGLGFFVTKVLLASDAIVTPTSGCRSGSRVSERRSGTTCRTSPRISRTATS